MIISDIELIVYDFDGVMTDNKVIISEDGKESVIVNRGDGLGVSRLKQMGITQIIISTEENPVVAARGSKLGIQVIQGAKNKRDTLRAFCNENHLDLQKVLYIGNDINDYDAMMEAGMKVCPADAEPEIKEIADIILERCGGEGVVRELLRHIVKS
jgi:YrbI family 3-deoxy-D-manno-octulosonate 8-phosphate phosphatase